MKEPPIIECHGCGDLTVIDSRNMHTTNSSLRRKGWKVLKREGEYIYYCPNCVQWKKYIGER